MKSIEPLAHLLTCHHPEHHRWMSIHDSFAIFGCEDGLDEEDSWLFQQIWMWGRSGWWPMILSTYSDVRTTVWMTTYDFFDIFGCEDGLDEEHPWLFQQIWMWGWSGWGGFMILRPYSDGLDEEDLWLFQHISDVRMVWMTTHDSIQHIRMWGWSTCLAHHSKYVLWSRQGSYNKISSFKKSSY